MPDAQAGHGTLIAVELPGASPGVFTTVALLDGDITWPALTRPKTVTTAHQHRIGHNVRGVMEVGDLTFRVSYDFDDPTHSFDGGLHEHMTENNTFGLRVRGPNGTTNVDEWIMSGGLINIEQTSPVREGVRSCNFVFAPSGPFKIDGTIVGADAS